MNIFNLFNVVARGMYIDLDQLAEVATVEAGKADCQGINLISQLDCLEHIGRIAAG